MAPVRNGHSTVELFADLFNQTTDLFRNEIRLARAEIDAKLTQLMASGVMVAAGAVAALAAVMLLMQAIVTWLAFAGMPERWGYLLVGVVVAILALVLVNRGLNALKATRLMPEKTIDQFKADFAAVKEHVK